MKVFVACEFSGVVRDAFARLGNDSWSCDLIPSESPNHKFNDLHGGGKARHIQTDVGGLFLKGWGLLIAHPPCTYLCNSGVRWLAPGGTLNRERYQKMTEACDFFAALYFAKIPRIAIENPVMHKYARDYLKFTWKIPTYTQTIQPWQFGHGEIKRTCLWLRNLPALKPTEIVSGREPRVHHASPGVNRWKERSRTLSGIANAMAEQWGNLV